VVLILNDFNENEKKYVMCCIMMWQSAGGFDSLEQSINQIGKNKILVNEIIEVLEILIDKIDLKKLTLNSLRTTIKVTRYTRDQILVAFGLSTFDKKSSNREERPKIKI
jgi:hypothetical protein